MASSGGLFKRGRRNKKNKIEADKLTEAENAVKQVDLVKDWVRVFKTNYIFDKCKGLNFD